MIKILLSFLLRVVNVVKLLKCQVSYRTELFGLLSNVCSNCYFSPPIQNFYNTVPSFIHQMISLKQGVCISKVVKDPSSQ